MSDFSTLQKSVEESRPIELYEFSYQGGTFRYTSAERDIEFEGNVYTREQLSRTAIDKSNEIGRSPITVTARSDFPPSELFNYYPPEDVVKLVIREMQYAASPVVAPGLWIGRVLSADWPSDKSQLKCESILSSVNQMGLRRTASRNCQHILYEQGDFKCNVNRNLFAVPAVVLSVSGLQVEATAFGTQPDGYFTAGYIELETIPGQFTRRSIKKHVGTFIEITHPIRGFAETAVFTAYPGCDHTWDGLNGCVTKFNNAENHGGIPHFVSKNLFGQNSVFEG